MEVLDEVNIGDATAVKRGASASGEVTVAEEKKRMGRAGKIAFSLNYISAADDSHIAASAKRKQKGSTAAGTITTGIVVSAIVFAPAAPLFLLKHGKDTEIPFGIIFTVYTSADAPVDLANVPAPIGVRAAPQSPTTTEHSVEGYTRSGPGAGTSTYAVVSDDAGTSVADAARIAKARKDARNAGQR